MDKFLTLFEDTGSGEKRPKRKGPITEREHELQGLLQGIVVDGEVNLHETEFLKMWLEKHSDQLSEWPSSPLLLRLKRYLEDGVLDADEQRELIALLKREVALSVRPRLGLVPESICFDDPVQPLPSLGAKYCLTGTFRAGKREFLEEFLDSLGAKCCGSPSKAGCLVVIGSHGYPDGKIHDKVEKACGYRSEGNDVQIITEEDWWETFGKYFR